MNTPRPASTWLIVVGFALSSAAALAQTNAPPAAPAASQDQTVSLPAYVVGTQGMGYVDANSVSGFKTEQTLLDIPQADLVMTQDFIQDVGVVQKYLTDSLAYAGVATWMRNGTQGAMIRGSRAITNLTDNIVGPNYWGYDMIDSFEVIKGSLAVVYYGGALTGSIVATTKKPLEHEQNIINISGNSWGGITGMLDSTGPIGSVGNLKLAYRVIAGEQHSGLWFNNSYYDQNDVHFVLRFDYFKANLIIAYDLEQVTTPWNTNGILLPSGNLYDGAGYKNADNYNPTASHIHGFHRVLRLDYLQRISDNWESKLYANAWTEQEYGGNIVNTGVNWQTNTLSGIFRQNNQPVYSQETEYDVLGHYNIWKIPALTTFGGNYYINSSRSEFWTTTIPGVANTFAVPIGPNLGTEIAALHIPQYSNGEYIIPNPKGSIAKSIYAQIAGQEQLDIVPNWVSVVAGYSWAWSENITDSNIDQYPTYTTVSESPGVSVWVPRYGFILHVTHDISLYGLYSQTQAINGSLDINNNRLPNQLITSREVGVKSALLQGHVVVNASVFRVIQSNQAVFSGLTNAQGVGYYLDDGTVTNEGWDGSIAWAPFEGLQVLGTWYVGTVKNQANVQVSPGYGNSMSLFVRYEMPHYSSLKGLAFGGGFNRIGSRFITTGSETFPVGWTEPSFFKMESGTQAEVFAEYQINHHLKVYVNVANLLDSQYPQGSQSPSIIDAAPPQAVNVSLTYTF